VNMAAYGVVDAQTRSAAMGSDGKRGEARRPVHA